MMPQPDRGYWVDRRSLSFASEIYRCPRATCDPAGADSIVGTTRQRALAAPSQSCWAAASYLGENGDEGIACSPDILMCSDGARSPLCGSCEEGFIYSSSKRVCTACAASQLRAGVITGVCAVLTLLTILIVWWVRRHRELPSWLAKCSLWGIFKHVDGGALKVAWSNYQVIG
jgi:hypothetical protein